MAKKIINIGATANDGTGTNWRDAWDYVNQNFTELYSAALDNRVVVKTAADLSGDLDSTKQYFIDGVIDMGSQSITVPPSGLTLSGYDTEVSKLISTASGYTMFVSPLSNSGGIIGDNFTIEVTGSSSQVYDITDATGFNAIEINSVNYNNCASLGTITGYRQGLELNTGRFGGKPELTLAGTWVGGFATASSIARNLDDGVYTLFKAGSGFTMASRFKTDANIDLPASASFFDFSDSNFPNPSTVQLSGCILTRNGVFNASDSNITPNMLPSDLSSDWSGNNGIKNTFVGGELNIDTEVTTTISSVGVFVDMAGTFTPSDLQHFDEPSNGQLRHLGSSPLEFSVDGQFILDSTSNNEVDLKLVIYRAATTSFEDGKTVRRVVNNLQGGRDVAYFTTFENILLNQNDYIKFQVANASSTSNITAELDSYFTVRAR